MSFNKRYFSKENIIEKAQSSDFNTFDTWMVMPDACIFEHNDGSYEIWNEYNEAGEREQYHLYIKLRQ
jgi:hypothetical protein